MKTWLVKILDRGDHFVALRVVGISPDAGEVPASKVFALRLLQETAVEHRKVGGRWGKVGIAPLGEVLNEDLLYDRDFDEDLASEFIRRVDKLDAKNDPWDGAIAEEAVKRRLLARGLSEKSVAWEQLWTEEWTKYWRDPDEGPQATLRIVVTDQRWIQHLTIGSRFESTAFA